MPTYIMAASTTAAADLATQQGIEPGWHEVLKPADIEGLSEDSVIVIADGWYQGIDPTTYDAFMSALRLAEAAGVPVTYINANGTVTAFDFS